MIRHILATILALAAGGAFAQDLLDSYVAYIGEADLYNSKGARLSEPWQVLRQDRANYHRYGIRQPMDMGDRFFSSMENRAIMERMVRSGTIDRVAARNIMRGNTKVFVQVYGLGNRGDYVSVTVGD